MCIYITKEGDGVYNHHLHIAASPIIEIIITAMHTRLVFVYSSLFSAVFPTLKLYTKRKVAKIKATTQK